MNKLSIIISFLLIVYATHTQEPEKYIYEGNEKYKNDKYEEAEIDYRKSLDEDPNSTKAKYNLANSLYKQGNFGEAKTKFEELTHSNFSKQELAKIYHNMGNSLLEEKKYQESIDAYIQSLKNNPKDQETKYNLAYAREMLRKQQQQNKDNQQNQDQNQDQQNQKDKQDQNKDQKDEQNKDQQNQDGQNQEQNKDKDGQQQDKQNGQEQQDKQNQQKDGQGNQQNKEKPKDGDKAQQMQQNKISKQDAERILQAMMQEEKELQKKMRKLKSNDKKTGKNW